MGKLEDRVNEILNITEQQLPEKKVEVKPPVVAPKNSKEADADYDYSRDNFYNLIERGQDAIDGILNLAKESEHPRTYEVAGGLIKNVGEVIEKLTDLQLKMKELKKVPKSGPNNVTNALFVGSSKELQNLLKKSKIENENTESKIITPEETDVSDK